MSFSPHNAYNSSKCYCLQQFKENKIDPWIITPNNCSKGQQDNVIYQISKTQWTPWVKATLFNKYMKHLPCNFWKKKVVFFRIFLEVWVKSYDRQGQGQYGIWCQFLNNIGRDLKTLQTKYLWYRRHCCAWQEFLFCFHT